MALRNVGHQDLSLNNHLMLNGKWSRTKCKNCIYLLGELSNYITRPCFVIYSNISDILYAISFWCLWKWKKLWVDQYQTRLTRLQIICPQSRPTLSLLKLGHGWVVTFHVPFDVITCPCPNLSQIMFLKWNLEASENIALLWRHAWGAHKAVPKYVKQKYAVWQRLLYMLKTRANKLAPYRAITQSRTLETHCIFWFWSWQIIPLSAPW